MKANNGLTSRYFPPVLAAGLALVACSGMDSAGSTPATNRDAGADTEADFACLPDCYRQAFETCQPTGTCVAEVAPDSNKSRTEDWVCFSNGVRTHMVGTMDGSGTVSGATDISTAAGLCGRFELTEGAAGAFYTIKDASGAVLASAAITSYPGITIACSNMEQQLDRTTPCGRAALLELQNAAGTGTLPSCTFGACSH